MITMSLARLLIVVAGAFALVTNAPTNAQTLKEKEKEWRSCEGGYYTGPREGRRSYTMDKYLWVVTPAFAKRFCMPESMVSDELKGAEAIAFRMVDRPDSDKCGVDDDGKTHCRENGTARLEIYLPQALSLPAANPQVKFFEDARTTSESLISSNVPLPQAKHMLYRKGQYQIPLGRLPRFKYPYSHPDLGYPFIMIYAHEGKPLWSFVHLSEVGFRSNSVEGYDTLILEEELGIFFGFEMKHYLASKIPQGTEQGQYLIALYKRNDFRRDRDKDLKTDYEHVIYLPHQFGQKIREIAMKAGGSNWRDFINIVRVR